MSLSFCAVTKLSKFYECLTVQYISVFLSQAEFIPEKFWNDMFCLAYAVDAKTDSFASFTKAVYQLKKK